MHTHFNKLIFTIRAAVVSICINAFNALIRRKTFTLEQKTENTSEALRNVLSPYKFMFSDSGYF